MNIIDLMMSWFSYRLSQVSTSELTHQLLQSDYFLDINPRILQRLINIIAMTGRLLRANQVLFSWKSGHIECHGSLFTTKITNKTIQATQPLKFSTTSMFSIVDIDIRLCSNMNIYIFIE
jgi:hypothetical protein